MLKTCIAKTNGQYFPDVLANDYILAASNGGYIVMGIARAPLPSSAASSPIPSLTVGPNYVYASNIISSNLTVLSTLEFGNVQVQNMTFSYDATESITFGPSNITIWNPTYFLQGVTFLVPVMFSSPLTANSLSLGDLSALSLNANLIYSNFANICNLTSNSIEANLIEASQTSSSQFFANTANVENAFINVSTTSPTVTTRLASHDTNNVLFYDDLTISENASTITLICNTLHVGSTSLNSQEIISNVPSYFSNIFVDNLDCNVLVGNISSEPTFVNGVLAITAQNITFVGPQLESVDVLDVSGNLVTINANIDALSFSLCNANTINSNVIKTTILCSNIFYCDNGKTSFLSSPMLNAQNVIMNSMNSNYANIGNGTVTNLYSTFISSNSISLYDPAFLNYLASTNFTSNSLICNSLSSNIITSETAQSSISNITVNFTTNFTSNLLRANSLSVGNITANEGNIYSLLSTTTTNANILNCETLSCYENMITSNYLGKNCNVTSFICDGLCVTSLLSSTNTTTTASVANIVNVTQSSLISSIQTITSNITNVTVQSFMLANTVYVSYFGTLIDASNALSSSIITNTNYASGQILNAQNINFSSSYVLESTFSTLNSNTINTATFTGDTSNISIGSFVNLTSPNGTFENGNIGNMFSTSSISVNNASINIGYITNMTISEFTSNSNLTSNLSCTSLTSNMGNISFQSTETFVENLTASDINGNKCFVNILSSSNTLASQLNGNTFSCLYNTNITGTLTSNNTYSNVLNSYSNFDFTNGETSNLSISNIHCNTLTCFLTCNTIAISNSPNLTPLTVFGNGNIEISNNLICGALTTYIDIYDVNSINLSDTLTTQNLNVLNNLSIPSLSSNDMTVTESLTVSSKCNISGIFNIGNLESNHALICSGLMTTKTLKAESLTFIGGTVIGVTGLSANNNITASTITLSGNLTCDSSFNTTITSDNLTIYGSLESNGISVLSAQLNGNLTMQNLTCTSNISGSTLECNLVTCPYISCSSILSAPYISVTSISPLSSKLSFSKISVSSSGYISSPDMIVNNTSINSFMQSIATSTYISSCVSSIFNAIGASA